LTAIVAPPGPLPPTVFIEDILVDSRLETLKDWVGQLLDLNEYEVRPASTDASFRRYFRVSANGATYIVMDAPPEKEDMRPFIEIAGRLYHLGLNVPEVLEQDLARGYLLLTDLGQQMYLPQLNESTVERLYGDALGALVILQAGIFTDPSFLPDYDEVLLRRELELFREWYLGRQLGLTLSRAQTTALDEAFTVLVRSALAQPRVWVHRDYHSRNLMVTPGNNPGILDFQDAVRGPATYDLVSLLRDCYIAWPYERVEDWALGYQTLALQSGLPVSADEAQFLREFDLMGVQRHLKATGIFARLNHRDGKPAYLNDIPRTLGYVVGVSGRHPGLQGLHNLLMDLRIPGITA
jgi:aminoglycoside/choline kinase family phosphotransferase